VVKLRGVLKGNLIWVEVVVSALVLGVCLGAFWQYATGVEHPIASKPIKVDYCFLFSHEDLFRGQPVEIDAHYMLAIEGAVIGKDECPDNDAVFLGSPADDPIGKEWDKDLPKQLYPAKFDISFVGVIPSYPRYRYWLWDAKNQWQPVHHVPLIRILRLTHFQRTR
jgi:hypothetical protein